MPGKCQHNSCVEKLCFTRSPLWMPERMWKTMIQSVQHSSISKNQWHDPAQKPLRETELSG